DFADRTAVLKTSKSIKNARTKKNISAVKA
ncbi:MAG: hypothetical protein ACJAZR_001963, partial [Sediminicola sp.]